MAPKKPHRREVIEVMEMKHLETKCTALDQNKHTNLCLKEGPCVLLCTQPRKEKKKMPWTFLPCQLNACGPTVRSRTRVHTLRAFGRLRVQDLARPWPWEPAKTLKTILRIHKCLQGYMCNFQNPRNVVSEARGEQGTHWEYCRYRLGLGLGILRTIYVVYTLYLGNTADVKYFMYVIPVYNTMLFSETFI